MNTHTKLILASALLLGGGTALAADPRPTGPSSGAKPPQAAVTNPRPQQGGANPETLSPARKSGPDSLSPAHTGTGGAQQPQAQGVPGAPGVPCNPGAGAMINKDVIPMPRPETMRSVGDDSQLGTASQQRKIPNPTASQAPGTPASPAASQTGPRNPGAGAMINKDVIPMPRPDIMPNTDGGSQQPGRPLPGAGPRPQP